MKRRKKEEQAAIGFILPALIIVFGIVIIPILVTFIYSIVDNDLMSSTYGSYKGFSFYIKILSDIEFWKSLGRTLYYTVTSTAIETIMGLAIALLLNNTFPTSETISAMT